VPNQTNCDDGVYCNGPEPCDPVLGCQAAMPVDCDDGVSCTQDTCDETTDSCRNIPIDADCEDDLFCTGTEVCDLLLDCVSSGDPCQAGGFCNEATDTCDDCQVDGDCDDGVGCTDNLCLGGICVYLPVLLNCDDGLYCTGIETCDAVLDCQAGTPIDCNDGVACTDDICNETTETCDNLPNNANYHGDVRQPAQ
jgi:hypothetical protein